MRVFLGESAFSFGRVGLETCHSVGEHRGFREAFVGVEGQVADTSPVGRVGGDSVARFGVPVAGPSRIVAGSQFGHSEPKSKAPTSSRRLHPTLRRRDARVDGVSSPGFASCSSSRTDPRSDEDLPDFDASSTGMAAGDPSPVHICTPFCSGQHGDQPIEVTGLQFHSRSRYGLRGVRVGEASHPGPATPSSSGRAEFEARGSLPNEELLQFLEQHLSTRTRRRVRRKVRDSDSDGPLMQVDLRFEEEAEESRVSPSRVTGHAPICSGSGATQFSSDDPNQFWFAPEVRVGPQRRSVL